MFIFCFNVTATPEIYTYLHTLSLRDALPILPDIIWDIETADGGARKQNAGGEGVTAVVQLVNARMAALIAGQARNAAPQGRIAGIRDVRRSSPRLKLGQRISQADGDARYQQNERQSAQALQDQNHISAEAG